MGLNLRLNRDWQDRLSRVRIRWPRRGLRTAGILIAALMVAVATACQAPSTNTYPFDYFPEMHYEPSYRVQEPPRLYPATGAVPVTGQGQDAMLFPVAAPQEVPATPMQEPIQKGADIFRVNCVACHGVSGKGDGVVAAYFKAAKATPPADLTATRLSNDQIFQVITNGRRDPQTLVGMPPFGDLLTIDQRNALVDYIRSLATP